MWWSEFQYSATLSSSSMFSPSSFLVSAVEIALKFPSLALSVLLFGERSVPKRQQQEDLKLIQSVTWTSIFKLKKKTHTDCKNHQEKDSHWWSKLKKWPIFLTLQSPSVTYISLKKLLIVKQIIQVDTVCKYILMLGCKRVNHCFTV